MAHSFTLYMYSVISSVIIKYIHDYLFFNPNLMASIQWLPRHSSQHTYISLLSRSTKIYVYVFVFHFSFAASHKNSNPHYTNVSVCSHTLIYSTHLLCSVYFPLAVLAAVFICGLAFTLIEIYVFHSLVVRECARARVCVCVVLFISLSLTKTAHWIWRTLIAYEQYKWKMWNIFITCLAIHNVCCKLFWFYAFIALALFLLLLLLFVGLVDAVALVVALFKSMLPWRWS